MVSLSFLCFLYMALRICSYRTQVIFVIFLRIGVYVRSRIKLFCVTLHNLLSLIVDIFLYDLIICLKHSAHIISILIIGLLYCLGNDVQDCGFDLASFMPLQADLYILYNIFSKCTSGEVIYHCHGLQQKDPLSPMKQSQIQVSLCSNNNIKFSVQHQLRLTK